MYNIENVFPDWTLEKQIGKGSYGTVYKAVKNNDSSKACAIKIIEAPGDASELDSLRQDGLDANAARTYLSTVVEDLVSEIRMMELLRGFDNIVRIEEYKVVEHPSELYFGIFIRMELLTPFNTYICDKKLTEDEVIKLGCDILSALSVCAKHNIIHRDIKPENILLNDFGDYKLGDFGVARNLEHLTVGLSQKGTFNYIAPEVVSSSVYDTRADIYSLGIVLYRLLNKNRFPFLDTDKQILSPGERKNALDRRLRGEPLKSPCEASPHMAEVILKACQHDPNKRFSNADEFKEALINVREQTYKSSRAKRRFRSGFRTFAKAGSAKNKLAVFASLTVFCIIAILLTVMLATTARMPQLLGSELAVAKEKLKKRGFSQPDIIYEVNEAVPHGNIISQNIAADTRTQKDESITLTVSLGKKAVSRIFISRYPDKEEYTVGESYTSEGLCLTVRYNDKTEEVITDGFTVDAPERFMKTGYEAIGISYGGHTTKYPVNISFGAVLASGMCGSMAFWSLNTDGILYISGNGDMYDYSGTSPAPWKSNLEDITEVIIEDGITSIGDFAFIGAKSITEFYIHKNIESFGQSALGECDSLKFITVDKDNKHLTNDSFGILYNKDRTMIIKCPPSADVSKYTIPDTVTSIYGSAFRATNLTSVKLPEKVSNVGDRVFYQCTQLRDVTIYNRDVKIDKNAFADTHGQFILRGYNGSTAETYAGDCGHKFEELYTDPTLCGNSLKWELSEDGELVISGEGDMWNFNEESAVPWHSKRSDICHVSISSGVTSISLYAFNSCPKLTEITVDEGNTAFLALDGVLYNKKATRLIRYPQAKADPEFTLPASVTAIYDYAFSGVTALTKIDFSSVVTIGGYAFKECKNLSEIILPEGVTSIGRLAFWECDGIMGISLPSTLNSIGTQAFGGCDSLVYISVPKTNEFFFTDSDGILYNRDMTVLLQYPPARAAAEYTIPIAVTKISDSAFHDAVNLEKVTLHGNIKSIGWSAFLRAKKLNDIVIPDSVTVIESSALRECPSLNKVTVKGKNVTFGDNVFLDSGDDLTIFAPGSSTAKDYAKNHSISFVGIGVQK